MVVQGQQFAQFAGKAFGIFEVLHAQRSACNFVFVGGANAASCGANFFTPTLLTGSFTCYIQGGVERQNQGTSFADAQARTHLHTGFFQPCNFFKQFGSRQNHAIADVALHPRTHDAAGYQVQSCFDTIDDQGVACIVAPLKSDHSLRAFGQPINQFAFALIAPLGADDDHIASFDLVHFCVVFKWL